MQLQVPGPGAASSDVLQAIHYSSTVLQAEVSCKQDGLQARVLEASKHAYQCGRTMPSCVHAAQRMHRCAKQHLHAQGGTGALSHSSTRLLNAAFVACGKLECPASQGVKNLQEFSLLYSFLSFACHGVCSACRTGLVSCRSQNGMARGLLPDQLPSLLGPAGQYCCMFQLVGCRSYWLWRTCALAQQLSSGTSHLLMHEALVGNNKPLSWGRICTRMQPSCYRCHVDKLHVPHHAQSCSCMAAAPRSQQCSWRMVVQTSTA